jgi:hypothetical protein
MVFGVMGVAFALSAAETINMLYQKKAVQKILGDF